MGREIIMLLAAGDARMTVGLQQTNGTTFHSSRSSRRWGGGGGGGRDECGE